METTEDIDRLSECIMRAIQEHFATSNINLKWPHLNSLAHPILRIDAFLEDRDEGHGRNESPRRSEHVASSTVDLTRMLTPTPLRIPNTDRSDRDRQSPSSEHHSREDTEPPANEHMRAATPTGRKEISGLRIASQHTIEEDASEHQRQIQADGRSLPKRRKIESDKFVFQPSTLDKLIIGIWEQIHGSLNLDPKAIFEQFQIAPPIDAEVASQQASPGMRAMEVFSNPGGLQLNYSFTQLNTFCRKVTQASRVCRSIEIIVQARWIELFDEQIELRSATTPELSLAKRRKAVFMEACQDFGWSEKELRNKMAVWRGYKEIKDAAGWAALVFAGMGIYRFCKYRVGFTKPAMKQLQNLRKRFEVAADTLHPNWRQLLTIVGEPTRLQYTGHPHDWVVCTEGSAPAPLRQTYLPTDPFSDFENIDESIVDETVWGCEDPRWIPQTKIVGKSTGVYICASCGEQQSDDPKSNSCYCFPQLFGCIKRKPPLVQVYRTPDGRNNGLVALTSFEPRAAIGEFIGLITKGVRHLDVMDSTTPQASYQIWQGRVGNFTRFVNHSCKPNAQFSKFTWLDTQRIILVSKGVAAGGEIFVDYGDKYWAGLDKACLCGEPCCRYKRRG